MDDFEPRHTTTKLDAAVDDPKRRDFLRLGFSVLPCVSLSLLLPRSLWAAGTGTVTASLLAPKLVAPAPSPLSKPKPPRLLMIDPGHGGHDPGAISLSGVQEKDITLDIAARMAKLMAAEQGLRVGMTRQNDSFLSLADRVNCGKEARADLFVSIHADSAPNHKARGLSAYTLSQKASDQFASLLADKENHADVIGGVNIPVEDKDVAAILFDLAARRTRNTAQRVKVGFIKGMGRRWTLLEQPMRAANFAVLRSPEVPSLLIETGFLSNREDEAILIKPHKRQKIAALMAKELSFLLRSSLFG
ncbi:MAG: N-acetylmuramoyl-L-alanine amidase [Alphaproteobacteria bacterium]|nr:N-acetylmuramoyl-L-alanine amidase [Alphaproteobacteria bacterium]